MNRSRYIVVLAFGVILSLAACGGGGSKASPTPTPITADAILDQASQRFKEVNSAHFTLDIGGDAFLDEGGTLKLRGAEGDMKRPDSATAKADISFGGAPLSISMIAIGNDQYITNFLTGSWERAPEGLGYNPAILFDDQKGIAGVLADAKGATLAGEEEVDGTEAYHLTGDVSKEAVTPMTGGAFKSDRVAFDLWVSKDTKDILKIVLQDAASGQGSDSPTWTLRMSKHNDPVTINAPDV